jgi:hypothetical protein
MEKDITEEATYGSDPLEDKWLLTDADYWKESKVTTLSFYQTIYNLGIHSEYFTLGYPKSEDLSFDVEIGQKISPTEFSSGKIETSLGLWINAGNEQAEPIAFWKGSTFPKKNLQLKQVDAMRRSGSIILAPSYLRQIEIDINKYFKAKDALVKTNPSHKALQYAPASKEDINPIEILWLWYWYNAIHRRKERSYSVPKQKFNVMQIIPLVAMTNLSLDKKILFSHLGMTDYALMNEYAELPNDWICKLHDVETPFIKDLHNAWVFPEMPPRY